MIGLVELQLYKSMLVVILDNENLRACGTVPLIYESSAY